MGTTEQQISNRQAWVMRTLLAVVIVAGLTARFTPPWSINPDVASHAYFATMLINGATPYVDFVDPNPPLIFYLYTIPAAISQSTGWPLQPVLDTCVLCLIALSLTLCMRTFRWSTHFDRPGFLYLILAVFVYILVLYPKSYFGQREHLVIILVLPYLCMAITRVESNTSSAIFRISVGLLAGVGFALKAHFLLVPLLVAVTLRLLRVRRAFFSMEHLSIGAMIACYLFHFLFWSEAAWLGFLQTVRAGLEVYHGYNMPLRDLLLNPYSIGPTVVAMACIGYPLGSKKSRGLMVIGVAIIGFLVAAYVQAKGWPYHYFPAVLLALIGVTLIAGQGLSFAIAAFAQHGKRRRFTVFATMAIAVLSIRTAYRWTNTPLQGCRQELIQLVNQNAPNGSIATLSTMVKPSFPLVTYTQTTWALRFNCLWLLPGLYAGIEPNGSEFPYRPIGQAGKVEKFLLNAVAEDIERSQPDLLIIDRKRKQALDKTFDLLAYFIRVPKFRQQFQHYELLKRFDTEDVYIRISDGHTVDE